MTDEKSWSGAEEKLIETIMKEKKVSHAVAARLTRTAAASKSKSADKVLAKVATAIKTPKPKREGYDRELIVKLWDKGMRPCEIAVDGREGIKGISAVYVSRVLFGSKNSGGVTAEQAERVKEAKQRAKQRVEAREEEAKADKK
jgi:hypothetical protein